MNAASWDGFTEARKRFKKDIEKLNRMTPELQSLQQKLVDERSPAYTVETPVVYNKALDDVDQDEEIKLILVGDNPGRREQAKENCRYLVGPSGKIAEKFFRDNPSLGINFRANVIILNKTPVHTPRTADLRKLCRLGGEKLEKNLAESQRIMARLLFEFHQAVVRGNAYGRHATGRNAAGALLPVWITGYSEMGKKGVFAAYAEELKAVYGNSDLKEAILIYRHFSMNQFTIDLKKQTTCGKSAAGKPVPNEPLISTLNRIGTEYRQQFLW